MALQNTFVSVYRRVMGIDVTAPPLLGPDRNPTFRDAWGNPLFRVYDPNSLTFGKKSHSHDLGVLPTQPAGPAGNPASGFGADMPREPQMLWDRSESGVHTKAFFRRIMGMRGLEHV